MAAYAAALLEELESLVEQLDQQEASKKQALDRAEAAERGLEALKLQQNSLVSKVSLLYMCSHQCIALWSSSCSQLMSQMLVCVYDAYNVIIIAALPTCGLVYVHLKPAVHLAQLWKQPWKDVTPMCKA